MCLYQYYTGLAQGFPPFGLRVRSQLPEAGQQGRGRSLPLPPPLLFAWRREQGKTCCLALNLLGTDLRLWAELSFFLLLLKSKKMVFYRSIMAARMC